MAIIYAVEHLFDKVVERFAQEGTAIDNIFGWKELPRQGGNINRIIWMPGDPSGSLGAIGGPRYPGQRATGKNLAMLTERFTCLIVGADPQAQQDDRAQYRAARANYDAWLRAIYKAAHGTYAIESQTWANKRLEGKFGAAIQVVGSVQATILDTPLVLAPIDTHAEATAIIGTSEDPPVEIDPVFE